MIDKWSPALQVRTVLLSVQALLSSPNPDDPLANDVAQHWKENEGDAINTAKQWTQRSVMSYLYLTSDKSDVILVDMQIDRDGLSFSVCCSYGMVWYRILRLGVLPKGH